MSDLGPSGVPAAQNSAEPVRVVHQRAPFLWANLHAVRRIAADTPAGPFGRLVRSVYFALCELAADDHDGKHAGFASQREEIATRALVSVRHVNAALEHLEALELLEIQRHTDDVGRLLRSTFVLLDPAPERARTLRPSPTAPSEDATSDATSQLQDATSDATSGLTRARPMVVKKEEEPHPPTPAPQAGQGSGGRRGSRASGTNPRASAARAALVRHGTPPSRELEASWQAIRHELKSAVDPNAWALYLEPLELLGTHGEVLLIASPDSRPVVGERFGRLLTAAVHYAEPRLAWELVPAGTTLEAKTAAA